MDYQELAELISQMSRISKVPVEVYLPMTLRSVALSGRVGTAPNVIVEWIYVERSLS